MCVSFFCDEEACRRTTRNCSGLTILIRWAAKSLLRICGVLSQEREENGIVIAVEADLMTHDTDDGIEAIAHTAR